MRLLEGYTILTAPDPTISSYCRHGTPENKGKKRKTCKSHIYNQYSSRSDLIQQSDERGKSRTRMKRPVGSFSANPSSSSSSGGSVCASSASTGSIRTSQSDRARNCLPRRKGVARGDLYGVVGWRRRGGRVDHKSHPIHHILVMGWAAGFSWSCQINCMVGPSITF